MRNLAAATIAAIESDLDARWHAAHCSAGTRTSLIVQAELEGAQALYATAKARGDRDEMDAQRARGAALVAELDTLIALADEAGGAYEESDMDIETQIANVRAAMQQAADTLAQQGVSCARAETLIHARLGIGLMNKRWPWWPTADAYVGAKRQLEDLLDKQAEELAAKSSAPRDTMADVLALASTALESGSGLREALIAIRDAAATEINARPAHDRYAAARDEYQAERLGDAWAALYEKERAD